MALSAFGLAFQLLCWLCRDLSWAFLSSVFNFFTFSSPSLHSLLSNKWVKACNTTIALFFFVYFCGYKILGFSDKTHLNFWIWSFCVHVDNSILVNIFFEICIHGSAELRNLHNLVPHEIYNFKVHVYQVSITIADKNFLDF